MSKNLRMNKKVLIFGFGYTATYFTKLLTEQQYHVFATSRDINKKQEYLDKQNINQSYITLVDFKDNNIEKLLKEVSYVLVSIAPNKDGLDPVIDEYRKIFCDNNHQIKWIGYLSSTGVYGNHDGNWVNEDSECLAKSATALNRLNAEKLWLDLYKTHNVPIHIFRLAGIYGPKKSVIDKFQSEKKYSVYKQGQMFSRIHVEDIANILDASMHQITPGEIYNVCDDMPAPSHEVDIFTANLLNIGELQLINYQEANLTPMAMEFYSSNKKVNNQKLKSKLKYNFKFPNYKIGLKNILENN